MHFRKHIYPSGNGSWLFFQVTNWNWRGVIVRIGHRQFDLFWLPQWSAGVED